MTTNKCRNLYLDRADVIFSGSLTDPLQVEEAVFHIAQCEGCRGEFIKRIGSDITNLPGMVCALAMPIFPRRFKDWSLFEMLDAHRYKCKGSVYAEVIEEYDGDDVVGPQDEFIASHARSDEVMEHIRVCQEHRFDYEMRKWFNRWYDSGSWWHRLCRHFRLKRLRKLQNKAEQTLQQAG